MRAPSLVLIGARVSGGAGVGTCAVAVGWVDCHEDGLQLRVLQNKRRVGMGVQERRDVMLGAST